METTKKTRRSIKQQAQDEIMHSVMTVFYRLADEGADQELIAEAHKQVNRIERLFRYEVGSWST